MFVLERSRCCNVCGGGGGGDTSRGGGGGQRGAEKRDGGGVVGWTVKRGVKEGLVHTYLV